MNISEKIAAIWEMEKQTPRVEREKEPALPWGEYHVMPKICTECGSSDLVLDGCYYCKACHPTYGKES